MSTLSPANKKVKVSRPDCWSINDGGSMIEICKQSDEASKEASLLWIGKLVDHDINITLVCIVIVHW